MTSPRLLTITAVAAELSVSRWTVYQLIWDRRLPSVHIGRCHRITREALDEYVSTLIEEAA